MGIEFESADIANYYMTARSSSPRPPLCNNHPMSKRCTTVSRRAVVLAGTGLATAGIASSQASGGSLTVGQVIDRIKANIGVPWREKTVDNLFGGSPDLPVKGIATTMFPDLDVLQRAAAAGKNFVISHETAVYKHQDDTKGMEDDPTFRFKVDFLKKNNMAVLHFHDHWHMRRPDGIGVGMARELGWEKNADPDNPRLFRFPGIPLGKFAKDIQTTLKIRNIRVVGDPSTPVNRVATSWGYHTMTRPPVLGRPDVDVFITGETWEWELVAYAVDAAIASGKKKGLILLGHTVSEQPGMKYCADWLKGFITEVPVEYIAAKEPFWSPDAPVAL
jgi:putative NIF3 family GTP cyclohydrolase 1 type 2